MKACYVLDVHIELRYMGMRKTLKVYFFVTEHDRHNSSITVLLDHA